MDVKNELEEYSLTRRIASITFTALGVLTLALTSAGITGNIVRDNSIGVDSGLLGFSLGILFIAISAMILIRKKK